MTFNRIRPESCRVIKIYTAELVEAKWGDAKYKAPLPNPPLDADKVWVPVEPEDDTEWLLADDQHKFDLAGRGDMSWHFASQHHFHSVPAGFLTRNWDKTITFKLGDARLILEAHSSPQEGSFYLGPASNNTFDHWRLGGFQMAIFTFRVEELNLTYMVGISVYCAKTKKKVDYNAKRNKNRVAESDLTPGRYALHRLVELLFRSNIDPEKHTLLLAQQADMQVDMYPTFTRRHTKVNSVKRAWAAIDLGIYLYDRWPKDRRDDSMLLTELNKVLTEYSVWLSRKKNEYHHKILTDFQTKLKAANPPQEEKNADQGDEPVLDGVPPLHGEQPPGDGAAHDPGDVQGDPEPV